MTEVTDETTSDKVLRLSVTPEFQKLTLQQVGDMVGVSRERVRQIVKKLGLARTSQIGRPRNPDNPIYTMTDSEIVAYGKTQGSAKALSAVLGLSTETLMREMRRRGITSRDFRPNKLTWRQLQIQDPDEFRRLNRERCARWRANNLEVHRAYLKRYRAEHPEVHRRATQKYQARKREERRLEKEAKALSESVKGV